MIRKMNADVTFREQSQRWLEAWLLAKRNAVAPAALRTSAYHVRRLLPIVAPPDTKLETINNALAKRVVLQPCEQAFRRGSPSTRAPKTIPGDRRDKDGNVLSSAGYPGNVHLN